MLTQDSVGLRRAHAQLERLCDDVPSLRTLRGARARGCRTLQGDYAGAYAIGNREITQCEAAQLHRLGARRRPAQMRDLACSASPSRRCASACERSRSTTPTTAQVTTMITPLIVELALIEAQLGDAPGAIARIEGYLEEIGERGGPTTRGVLHEARARIALVGRRPARPRACTSRTWSAGSGRPRTRR